MGRRRTVALTAQQGEFGAPSAISFIVELHRKYKEIFKNLSNLTD